MPCPDGTYSGNATGATGCSDCPTGSWSASLAGIYSITQCQCNAGFQPGAQDMCTMCEAGKYKESVGAAPCDNCPADTYSPNISARNRTTCRSCPELTSAPDGSTSILDCVCRQGAFTLGGLTGVECFPCRAGTYKETVGLGNCTKCPPHSYTPTTQSSYAWQCVCDPGWTGLAAPGAPAPPTTSALMERTSAPSTPALTSSTPAPTETPVNTSSTQNATESSSTTSPSPTSSSTSAAASTTTTAAFSTTAVNYSTPVPTLMVVYGCAMCEQGTYKNVSGSMACSECPAGKYLPHQGAVSKAQCLDCPAFSWSIPGAPNVSYCLCNQGYTSGSIENVTGELLPTCEPCSAGKYKPFTGPGECLPCDDAATSPVAAKILTQCSCNAGYTGRDGGACRPCPTGYYKDAIGSSACAPCPQGTYQSDQAAASLALCLSCPSGKSSPVASNTTDDCVCFAGYYRLSGKLDCVPCVPGTFKEDIGDFNCTMCDNGKYSNLVGSTQGSNCTSCDFGATTITAGSTLAVNCTCDKGYTGAIYGQNCTECPLDTYKATFGTAGCSDCRNFSSSPPASPSAASCECLFGFRDLNGTCTFQCPNGFYTSESGDSCDICPPNTFQPVFAARNVTWCLTCGYGAVSDAGSGSFQACFCDGGYIGYPVHPKTGVSKEPTSLVEYDTSVDPSATKGCVACPPDAFKEGLTALECTTCPPFSKSHLATPLEYGCKCDPGYTGGHNSTCCYEYPSDIGTWERCISVLLPGDPSALGSTRSFPTGWIDGNCTMQGPAAVAAMEVEWNETRANAPAAGDVNTSSAMGLFDKSRVVLRSATDPLICVTCAPGSYKPNNGSAPCLLCPNATYGFASAGVDLDATCHRCPANATSDQGSTLLLHCQCLPGFNGSNGTNCTACPPDTYKPERGEGKCLPCPANSYAPAASAWCHCNMGYEGPDSHLNLRDLAAVSDVDGKVAVLDAIGNVLWAPFSVYIRSYMAQGAASGLAPDITQYSSDEVVRTNWDVAVNKHWCVE